MALAPSLARSSFLKLASARARASLDRASLAWLPISSPWLRIGAAIIPERRRSMQTECLIQPRRTYKHWSLIMKPIATRPADKSRRIAGEPRVDDRRRRYYLFENGNTEAAMI